MKILCDGQVERWLFFWMEEDFKGILDRYDNCKESPHIYPTLWEVHVLFYPRSELLEEEQSFLRTETVLFQSCLSVDGVH